jgi:hypothetical protein
VLKFLVELAPLSVTCLVVVKNDRGHQEGVELRHVSGATTSCSVIASTSSQTTENQRTMFQLLSSAVPSLELVSWSPSNDNSQQQQQISSSSNNIVPSTPNNNGKIVITPSTASSNKGMKIVCVKDHFFTVLVMLTTAKQLLQQ